MAVGQREVASAVLFVISNVYSRINCRGDRRLRKPSIVISVLLALGLVGVGWAATLEQARKLESQGRRDAALEELDQILGSDAPAEEKAGALDLLGTIAVDEGDLQLAYQSWHRLVGEYPDWAKSLGAKTKLKLVTSLMEATGESPESASAEAPSAPPTGEKTTTSAPAKSTEAIESPDARTSPGESAPAAAASGAKADSGKPAESSQRPNPPPTSGKVLVAFSGKPYDAAVEAGEMVIAYLRKSGVDAVSATEGIPVVRDASSLVPVMVQRVRDEGATSAVLLDADFPGRQKVSAECYSPEGAELWQTKVVGGTGWTGRDYSKTGINEDLVERFIKKLSKRVGGPGLPVTMQ